MKTPPKMLSPKDAMYINDLMKNILVSYKKLDETTIEDQDVDNMYSQAKTLLKEQYTTLLGLLK